MKHLTQNILRLIHRLKVLSCGVKKSLINKARLTLPGTIAAATIVLFRWELLLQSISFQTLYIPNKHIGKTKLTILVSAVAPYEAIGPSPINFQHFTRANILFLKRFILERIYNDCLWFAKIKIESQTNSLFIRAPSKLLLFLLVGPPTSSR